FVPAQGKGIVHHGEDFPDRRVSTLGMGKDGSVWLGLENGVVLQMKDEKIISQFNLGKGFQIKPILGIVPLGQDTMVVLTGIKNRIITLLSKGEVIDRSHVIHLLSPKNIVNAEQGRVLISSANGLFSLNIAELHARRAQANKVEAASEHDSPDTRRLFSKRTYAVLQLSDNRYWAGTADGLFEVSTSGMANGEKMILPGFITDIKSKDGKEIWVTTNGDGIYHWKGGKFHHYDRSNGLASNVCRRVFVDESGEAWVASQHGVIRIRENANDPTTPQIEHLTQHDGLASNEVNDILVIKDKVYAATQKGLSIFPATTLPRDATLPSISITKFQIWDQDYPISSEIALAHDQNNLTIGFWGVSYDNRGNSCTYQYKMEGVDTAWHPTAQPSLAYQKLPPGEYKFSVIAVNEHGLQSPVPAQFTIRISPPFWQTWWFIGALVLLIGTLLLLVFVQRSRRIKARSLIRQQLLEAEQKALRAQMDPHFINNCLTSIQNLIIIRQVDDAGLYLARFARLVRMILEHSMTLYIPLSQELEALRLYLELEGLRFKDKLEYEIEVASSIDPNRLEVPSMLIQPFVENAIKWGLFHKPGKGRLQVHFTIADYQLICRVEDDGIGRKAARELGHSQAVRRNSLGMKVAHSRIEVLRNLSNSDLGLEIEDLFDASGQACGTRVEIRLPILAHNPSTFQGL
ncbi:MAG: histidine kinase, partial [Bacteroidota bacterium]